MFSKDMHVSLLLDFYGDILPERRYEMTSLYYNDDLSLSEIADICGISRQGVRDAVKKSELELHELEEKLGLAARFAAVRAQLDDISSNIEDISENVGESESAKLRGIAESLKGMNI